MTTRVRIFQDIDAENPRTAWDNLGTMVCFHRRYNLGDENHGYREQDYGSWEELEKQLTKDGAAIILPLYLYDHSGITISTGPFSCRWDSGQVGFIFITKEKIRSELGVKRITAKLRHRISTYLVGEVETYDQYLRGDVYGFIIEEDGEQSDSCWGFYGSDVNTNGMLEHIPAELHEQARDAQPEYL